MPKGSAKLPVSWLLSDEEEQFELHVSVCADSGLDARSDIVGFVTLGP